MRDRWSSELADGLRVQPPAPPPTPSCSFQGQMPAPVELAPGPAPPQEGHLPAAAGGACLTQEKGQLAGKPQQR